MLRSYKAANISEVNRTRAINRRSQLVAAP